MILQIQWRLSNCPSWQIRLDCPRRQNLILDCRKPKFSPLMVSKTEIWSIYLVKFETSHQSFQYFYWNLILIGAKISFWPTFSTKIAFAWYESAIMAINPLTRMTMELFWMANQIAGFGFGFGFACQNVARMRRTHWRHFWHFVCQRKSLAIHSFSVIGCANFCGLCHRRRTKVQFSGSF